MRFFRQQHVDVRLMRGMLHHRGVVGRNLWKVGGVLNHFLAFVAVQGALAVVGRPNLAILIRCYSSCYCRLNMLRPRFPPIVLDDDFQWRQRTIDGVSSERNNVA